MLLRSGWDFKGVSGDKVWAYACELPRTNRGLKFSSKPVYGVLSNSKAEDNFNQGKKAMYFIPFKKGTEIPDWGKGVERMSRDYATTEQEAIEDYNRKVNEAINKLTEIYESQMLKLNKLIIK